MILILGGAYQGKCAFLQEHFACTEFDIQTCCTDAPDGQHRAYCHLEQYVLHCLRTGQDETALLQDPVLRDSILLFDDISCGIVPMEAEQRRWRERTGRLLSALARQADEVWRVFFGLGRQLKP